MILFASECFFGASLILAAAWLMARGGSAAFRHLVWTVAFAAMLILPIAASIVPSQMVWYVAHNAPTPTPIVVAGPVAALVPPPSFGLADVVLALMVVWAAGVVFHLSKTAFGGVGLMLLYRASVPHIPEGLDAKKFRGLNWHLRLRTSTAEAGPITWGVFKPVVLLPKASVLWPRDRLEAVLLHEAAHVRRQDCLARLICVLACALYWPNPFVWGAARAMRREGEAAADDMVLTSGVRPSHYAGHLVGLARDFARGHETFAGMTLAMAEPSMLDARVEAILDPAQSRRRVSKKDVLKIAALALTATSVLALVRPSFAEAHPNERTAPVAVAEVVTAPVPAEVPVPAEKVAPAPRAVVAKTEASEVSDDAPPAPPAPLAPAAPPAPPAVWGGHKLSDAEKAEIHRAAHVEAQRAMAEARKAIEEAHIEQVVSDAMRQARLALRQAKVTQADAQKAVADAHIDKVVAEAMHTAEIALKAAEPKIKRAIEQAGQHGNTADSETDSDQ